MHDGSYWRDWNKWLQLLILLFNGLYVIKNYTPLSLLFDIFGKKNINRPSSLGQTSDLKKRLEVLDLHCRLMIRWSELWTRATMIKMTNARFLILVLGPTALSRGQRMKSRWNLNLFKNQTYTADCSSWIGKENMLEIFWHYISLLFIWFRLLF